MMTPWIVFVALMFLWQTDRTSAVLMAVLILLSLRHWEEPHA